MYNKLFTKILDSSIWLESMATRIVWLTFIAAMDENGFVQFASSLNVALRARVSIKAAEDAISCLEAPDPNSSDPDHEGRRIEKVPGGWMVLNAEKYRDLVTRAISQARTRERVAKHRERKRNAPVTPNPVTCNAHVTPSDTDTDTDQKQKDQKRRRVDRDVSVLDVGPDDLMEVWNATTSEPIPACRALSDKRRKLALSRLRELPYLEKWREVIAKIQASDFCRGQRAGAGTWVASFDWLLQPDTALKVLEGKYDNREGVAPQGKDTAGVRLAKVGADYLRGEGITARPERPLPARPQRQIAGGE